MVLVLGLGFASIPPAKANPQFVMAAYTYPSNNGNAISYITVYIDGVANGTMYYNPDSYPTSTGVSPLEVTGGVNLTLGVFCWVNSTYVDISSLAEGLNIMKHNVSVVCSNGTEIFSKQNFTYITGTDANTPMYFYRHDVILDFVPQDGEVYTVTVVYELFYEES